MTQNSLGWLLALLVVGDIAAEDAANNELPLSARYGFLEPEIYKVDFRIANLLARDVDGDGKLDLVVVNNLKNRIDVLSQRSRAAEGDETAKKPNEISSDKRLDHRKIPVRRTIHALEVRDVNHDGRADLVYLGDPSGLYVEYQQPDGSFGQERIFENADSQTSPWTIDVGDLNADGRADIAYLGRKYLYLVYQDAEGRLMNPKRFRLGEDGAGLLKILDWNADGRPDLVYFAMNSDMPFRVRLQDNDGSFGAERRMRIDPPRGVSFADFDDKAGPELLAISSLNDRFVVYGADESEPSDDRPTSQVVVFPLDNAGAGKNTDVVLADFDGDGRIDAVACEAESSQLQFFPQVRSATSFPCLTGTESLRAVDVDGDKRSALLTLSSKDKSIALSTFEDGRFQFPQALATKGEPAAMEVVGAGEQTRIVYLTKSTDSSGKIQYVLARLKPAGASDSAWREDPFSNQPELPLELSTKPTDLRAADVNGDGVSDLVVFLSFKPPVILLGRSDGGFEKAADSGKAALGNLTAADLWYGPLLDGNDALLVVQDSFARNLRMEENGRWKVVDQYNAASSSAKIKGVAVLDLVGDSLPEIVMYDRTSQSLVFLRLEQGVYRAWQSLKVGVFDVRGMRTADLNADGSMDVLFFDGEKMGMVYSRSRDLVVRPIASYETDNKDGQLFDMTPGDLNGDGKIDVLLLDPTDHNLEIVTRAEDGKIERALRWQVFEEKTFNRQSGSMEPREAVIADTNDDGLEDIVLLVHDRVLIYRQDPGSDPPVAAADKDAASK